ncbi:TPA: DUF131 domain-containing protein [Candidatus Bathyarchaeota archaeon]|nr:DUF131 domain-containing protein [Candidatus Bathyarchaeota archaeon]
MIRRTCEVCLKNQARYVCERCGRAVCDSCFDLDLWVCASCGMASLQPATVGGRPASSFAFKFIILGFALVFAGLIIAFFAILSTGLSKGGFVFFFGPVPIILGSDGSFPLSLVVLAALVLTFLGALGYLILRSLSFANGE